MNVTIVLLFFLVMYVIIVTILKIIRPYKTMSYTTVTTYTAKLRNGIKSDCICCSERRLIKTLKHDFYKRGYRPHQFSSWVNRKHGTLVICRETSYGDGISLPCVLCRKVIDKHDLKWIAHDGEKWIHSKKTLCIPKSQPTNKQRKHLGFGLNN
tara:strand:- start:4844 stop:5305 length:462 start_codon:yes stop_codon:yes gene_type:complete